MLVETHASWVLLTDTLAYKIKKPIRFSFLDFSTKALRKMYCEREVALNRRLAPDMYIGVVPLCREGSGIRIGATGEKGVDFAVKMRRMDDSRQLDLLLAKAEVSVAEIRELARMVAGFHRQATRVWQAEGWEDHFREFADLLSVKETLESVLGQGTASFLARVISRAEGFLRDRSPRIEARKAAGFVIDGHGDLHGRNVLMTNPPVVFDCIEFSDELRTLDVLSEIGFLIMDLERFGREDLAEAFLEAYRSQFECILCDTDHELLLFYKLYRANVRLKVGALALGPEPQLAARDMLQGYFNLFRAYAGELLGEG